MCIYDIVQIQLSLQQSVWSVVWDSNLPALFILNLRFNYRPNSPLQYPGVDFPREAEECDPPIVGTHPPVPLFK